MSYATQYLCTCLPTKATLEIDDQGEPSKAGEDSLYVFEGTDYSKSSAEDEKTFDALVAGALQCNEMLFIYFDIDELFWLHDRWDITTMHDRQLVGMVLSRSITRDVPKHPGWNIRVSLCEVESNCVNGRKIVADSFSFVI